MGAHSDLVLGFVLDTNGERATCAFSRTALLQSRNGTNPDASSSIGGLVKVDVGSTSLFGTVTGLAADRTSEATILAEIEYIGEGPRGSDGYITDFRRGLSVYPHPGDEVSFATSADFHQ